MRKKLARVGEYRTVVPKKGVYIHVFKTPRGVMSADILRRTKAHARAARKPALEELSAARPISVRPHYKYRKGKPALVRAHRRARKK